VREDVDTEIGQAALRHRHGEVVVKENHDGLARKRAQEKQGDGLQSR
jgi:hypothetical protein